MIDQNEIRKNSLIDNEVPIVHRRVTSLHSNTAGL